MPTLTRKPDPLSELEREVQERKAAVEAAHLTRSRLYAERGMANRSYREVERWVPSSLIPGRRTSISRESVPVYSDEAKRALPGKVAEAEAAVEEADRLLAAARARLIEARRPEMLALFARKSDELLAVAARRKQRRQEVDQALIAVIRAQQAWIGDHAELQALAREQDHLGQEVGEPCPVIPGQRSLIERLLSRQVPTPAVLLGMARLAPDHAEQMIAAIERAGKED
jgi:hypothetical protein